MHNILKIILRTILFGFTKAGGPLIGLQKLVVQTEYKVYPIKIQSDQQGRPFLLLSKFVHNKLKLYAALYQNHLYFQLVDMEPLNTNCNTIANCSSVEF